MSHLLVFAVAVPMLTAAIAILAEATLDGGEVTASSPRALGVVRPISWLGALASLGVAVGMVLQADRGETIVYRLGNWPSPFAIVFVLDRMSALMVAMTSVLAVFVALAARGRFEAQGRFFHALLHLQLMGLAGAFLTGDLFNLFVFFEILLIASYGLLLFGGGAERLSAGFTYILLNLVGSGLFLVAVGTLYGVLGTLNMADVGVRAAAAAPADVPILRTAALLLVIVFALKGAVAPLHLWLPKTYGAAIAPVTALFAVMTKVGLYAIARTVPMSFGPLLFPEGLGATNLLTQWLMPGALLTLVLATLGAAAAPRLKQVVCFLVLASVGMAGLAFGLFTPAGFTAGIYYMVHSTIVLAAFFLLADLIMRERGPMRDRLTSGPQPEHARELSVLFLVLAAAAVGLPPLSGFIGKYLMLVAAWELPWARSQIWLTIIVTSFISLVVMSRVGSVLFWNVGGIEPSESDDFAVQRRDFLPTYGLLAVALLLAALAEPVGRYAEATALQLLDRDTYIDRVVNDREPTPRALEEAGR